MAKAKFEFRGGCLNLIEAKEPEVILAGPRDTGKTVAACVKIHLYCLKCAGVNGNIMRKTNKSIAGSVLKTFDRVIKGFGVRKFGGENPTKYVYPNGSTIWIGGMDNADKVLSSERDFIYVNQAEEFTLSDWESCAGSCSGRGAIVRYPQLFGDCNPGGSKHWIRKRAAEGKLNLLNARHFDNPSLFNADGTVTEGGKKRLQVLENLTGIRRKRYYEGIWATSEGAVYDTFDPSIHVKERYPKEFKRFMLAMDEGYTNPAVILLMGDDGDGRRHVFREFYQRGVLQGEVVKIAKQWFDRPFPDIDKRCWLAAVDAAAAGLIADLVSVGVNAVGGKGRVIDGIQKIQDRLKVQGDGKPRLTFDPSCTESINEFESYVWKPDAPKDTPVKEHDHVSDSIRYMEDVDATPDGSFKTAEGLKAGQAATTGMLVDAPAGGGLFTTGKGFF